MEVAVEAADANFLELPATPPPEVVVENFVEVAAMNGQSLCEIAQPYNGRWAEFLARPDPGHAVPIHAMCVTEESLEDHLGYELDTDG